MIRYVCSKGSHLGMKSLCQSKTHRSAKNVNLCGEDKGKHFMALFSGAGKPGFIRTIFPTLFAHRKIQEIVFWRVSFKKSFLLIHISEWSLPIPFFSHPVYGSGFPELKGTELYVYSSVLEFWYLSLHLPVSLCHSFPPAMAIEHDTRIMMVSPRRYIHWEHFWVSPHFPTSLFLSLLELFRDSPSWSSW